MGAGGRRKGQEVGEGAGCGERGKAWKCEKPSCNWLQDKAAIKGSHDYPRSITPLLSFVNPIPATPFLRPRFLLWTLAFSAEAACQITEDTFALVLSMLYWFLFSSESLRASKALFLCLGSHQHPLPFLSRIRIFKSQRGCSKCCWCWRCCDCWRCWSSYIAVAAKSSAICLVFCHIQWLTEC